MIPGMSMGAALVMLAISWVALAALIDSMDRARNWRRFSAEEGDIASICNLLSVAALFIVCLLILVALGWWQAGLVDWERIYG